VAFYQASGQKLRNIPVISCYCSYVRLFCYSEWSHFRPTISTML